VGNYAKKLAWGFGLALALNWGWEAAHSRLYAHYQGGAITALILLRAAVVDAAIILALFFIAQQRKLNRTIVVVGGGLIVAVGLELWALQTGRWAYNALMPIIPLLKTGLTPTLQLALTGYITRKIVYRKT